MANELKHGTVGTVLTQAEWESITAHTLDSQATGDIIYAASSSQLRRLGVGSANDVLRITGGIPDWQATTFITEVGTIATGVWQGTDIGVAYGGTGVSTLTDGGVLLGSGSSAITAMAVLTDGQMIVGNGSTDPVAESGATLRTSIGVGTGDSPQFTGLTLTGDLAVNGDDITSDGGLTITPTTDTFFANGTGVVVGHSAQVTTGSAAEFQILGTGAADSSAVIGRWTSGASGPRLSFVASNNGTIGSKTIVADNDIIGFMEWLPDDGVDFATSAATFWAEVDDASPEAGGVGMAFVWKQMPGGGTTAAAETMRISAAGYVGIGTSAPSNELHLLGTLRAAKTDNTGLYTLLNYNQLKGIGGTLHFNYDEAQDITMFGGGDSGRRLEVGRNDYGADVKFFGDTAGDYVLWDSSDDQLELVSTDDHVNIYTIRDENTSAGDTNLSINSYHDEGGSAKFAGSFNIDTSANNTGHGRLRFRVGNDDAGNHNAMIIEDDGGITIGGGIAHDSRIVFDGNAQDFHIGLDDTADDLVIGVGDTLGTTSAIEIDSGARIGLGIAPRGRQYLRIAPTFTSDGSSTVASLTEIAGTLTGASGDTGDLSGVIISPTTVTQTATETITNIQSLRVDEPKITDNLTGDITTASTVRIVSAPSEGESNYALWVDDGTSRFDGNVQLTHIDSTDNQMTFNVDSDGNQTGEVFRWFKDGSAGAGTKLMELTAASQLDLQSNASGGLVNVGASGNDWDATGIDVIGTAASTFKRTTSATDYAVNSLIFRMISDGDAADGFGPQILFQITDTGVTNSSLGGLNFVRAGADNTGQFVVNVTNAGTGNDGLKLTSVGVLSVDLAGSGSAAQVDLFDEYDDPVELQRYTHMQSDKFNTENERQLSISRMLDMGVISEVPTSASGYHMNLQPMLRLVAGGIYQNRERIDSQYDEIDKRLAKIEQALGV